MAQQILSPSANYTLGNADDGKLVLLNGGATLSGPAESPMPPATGFYVDIRNVGGSDATFAPQGAGATVEGASSLTVAAGGCRR